MPHPLPLLPTEEKAFFPVVVSIDCEPDPRVTPKSGPAPWDGTHGTIALVEQWRKSVPGAGVGWYWRVDPQIERNHGDPAWPLQTYRAHIDATTVLGDEHGVHPHPWRWSDAVDNWVSDAADHDWMDRCIETSVAGFARALGRPVRAIRMGDGHMSARIMAKLAAAGLRCDLTLEPGAPATPSLAPDEHATGLIPDRTATPRRPYRAARMDPCREGRCWYPHRLWALPMTTAPAGIPGVAAGTVANLGFEPEKFRHIATQGMSASMAAGAAYLAVVARTDVGANAGLARFAADNLAWLSLTRLGPRRPRFVGPMEALAMLGAH